MEILIADQNRAGPISRDFLPEELTARFAVHLLRFSPGVVAARNACAAKAANDILVYLDDDARIASPHFLRNHLLNYLDPSISAVCGQELFPPDFHVGPPDTSQFASPYEEAEFFSRHSSLRRDVANICTCNCSVRREIWSAVGGFNSLFTGNSYGDDTDFALRLQARGYKIVFDPTASVDHLHWRSGGLRLSDPKNKFSLEDRYLCAWLLFLLHVPPKWWRWYLWHQVLRKSLFLKRNITRPYLWPAITLALARSFFRARALLRSQSG